MSATRCDQCGIANFLNGVPLSYDPADGSVRAICQYCQVNIRLMQQVASPPGSNPFPSLASPPQRQMMAPTTHDVAMAQYTSQALQNSANATAGIVEAMRANSQAQRARFHAQMDARETRTWDDIYDIVNDTTTTRTTYYR